MRVDQVMSHRAIVIDADASVMEAAERMRAEVIGVLPVVAHGRLVGIVTDRDLAVRVLARGLDAHQARVRQAMSLEPITCLPGESAEAAASLMSRHEVRRLVVVDELLAPVGIVSVDDFALFPETRELAIQVLSRVPELRGVELDGLPGPF